MSTHEYTVEFDEATYRALEAEARRRRVVPDALADELVRERLGHEHDPSQMERALTALAQFRAEVQQPVDAVALVRAGRDELKQRNLG